jgi:hypothetical protein
MRDSAKPHIKARTVVAMTNDLTKTDAAGVPDWMRKASTGASLGNIDSSDLKPPRLKVLAGQSPEIMDGVPGAMVGQLWMTVLNQNLGQSATGTPILLRKSYQVWAPRNPGVEQKGPLATASDGVHWDVPDQTFEVKFPGNPRAYTWRIGKLVTDFGASKWGSQMDDNPKSKPVATLTYDMLWRIDLPNGQKQLCVFTSSRTGITPVQTFISTLKAMGVDHFFQRYRIVVQRRTGPTGDPYFSYEFQYLGNIEDQTDGEALQALYDQYRKSGFIADLDDETTDVKPAQSSQDQGSPDVDEIPF